MAAKLSCAATTVLDQNHKGPGLSKWHNTRAFTATAKSLHLSVQMCRGMRLSTKKDGMICGFPSMEPRHGLGTEGSISIDPPSRLWREADIVVESAEVRGRKTPTALDDCSLEGMASNWNA
ncbi:hypothetical protein NL676_006011 [Syzygium grande]|nr:hypothetical protein NL676_006011 [Syzygium grande]